MAKMSVEIHIMIDITIYDVNLHISLLYQFKFYSIMN